VAGARWLRANRLVDGRATISFDTTSTRYSDITLGLAGAHQVQNALIAAATVELAMAQGIAASSEDVASGLEDVEWPARLEWVTTERGRVLLDAAHNPAGAHALASYLQDSATGRLPMIIAIMKDKDIDGIIRPLVPMASAFIATETGSERSLGATELMKAIAVIAPDVPVVAHAHWKDALSEAFGRQRHIVVAGSIFLVGPLRATLVRDNGPRA
jgi:dihydrofolate synthase/folylpolyglutamate synthase